MGPPSYVRSVVDRNVVMRLVPVLSYKKTAAALSRAVISSRMSGGKRKFSTFAPFRLSDPYTILADACPVLYRRHFLGGQNGRNMKLTVRLQF